MFIIDTMIIRVHDISRIIIGGTVYLMEIASRQATVGAEPVVEEFTMELMTTLELM